jgi:CDP-diglyceride synthetase
MIPVILSGILNMLFTKKNFYKKHNYPIDNRKLLKDGKRLFGENKTYIGFISMMLFCAIVQIICGLIYNSLNINHLSYFYESYNNEIIFNFIIGLILGFAYMICELPNSFIKRRLGINSGGAGQGFLKGLFLIIDQTDSMIGVMLVLLLFSNITFFEYIIFVIIGAFTHIFVNCILYILKIRKGL